MWSGAISFGLVNVPIKLYSAVSKKTVRFHQLNGETGSRIQQKRVDSTTGEEVPYENLVKGYELTKDRYVIINPDELDALDPEKSRTIDIEDFVDLAEIDPVYYDHPYYLVPDKGAAKAYGLLLSAMQESGRVAIARVVLRSKEQLVAIRPDREGRVLMMETMIFADEVVPKEDLDGLPEAEELKVSDREVKMAQQLIESLATDFEPERYKDEYREKVLELIEAKAAGEEIAVAPEAPAPAKVPGPDGRARGEPRGRELGRQAQAQERRERAREGEDLGRVDELEALGHARDLEHALDRVRAAHEHQPAVELLEPVARASGARAGRASPGTRARAGRRSRRRRPAGRRRRSSSGSSSPHASMSNSPAQRHVARAGPGRRSRNRTSTSGASLNRAARRGG